MYWYMICTTLCKYDSNVPTYDQVVIGPLAT